MHWASSKASTRTAPLHRVLCARAAGEPVAAAAYPVAGPPVGAVARSPWVVVEQVDQSPARSRWAPPSGERPALHAAPFTRTVDTTWRRTSYTGLTAAAHGPERAPAGFRDDEPEGAGAAAEQGIADDRRLRRGRPVPPGPRPCDATSRHELRIPSAFADLPGRSRVRHAGPRDPRDHRHRLRRSPRRGPRTGGRRAVGPSDARGGAADPRRRHRAHPAHTARPARRRPPPGRHPAGRPAGRAGLRAPDGRVDRRHARRARRPGARHVAAGDPLSGYPDHLAVPGLGTSTLRGYLSGSIDAVLRVPGPDGAPVPGRRLQDEPAARPRRTGRRAAGLGSIAPTSCPRR